MNTKLPFRYLSEQSYIGSCSNPKVRQQ